MEKLICKLMSMILLLSILSIQIKAEGKNDYYIDKLNDNDLNSFIDSNLFRLLYSFDQSLAINSISGSTSSHATALVGYAVDSNGVYYTVFDPFGTGSGKITVTYSSTISFTSNGQTYTWNKGYYKDIRL